MTQIATAFKEAGVPAPHQFDCEVKEASPVVRIKTTCGYDGFAIEDKDGKIVCPNCEANKAEYNSTQEQAVQTGNRQVAVSDMVQEAVNAQLKPLTDMIAKLTAQINATPAPAAPAAPVVPAASTDAGKVGS
jgi:hypothetical protein